MKIKSCNQHKINFYLSRVCLIEKKLKKVNQTLYRSNKPTINIEISSTRYFPCLRLTLLQQINSIFNSFSIFIYLREALGNKTLVRGQVGEVST